MSCVGIALDHGAPIRGERVQPVGLPAATARRAARRWSNRWWTWLAASTVVYPGGGIVHLLMTLPEDD